MSASSLRHDDAQTFGHAVARQFMPKTICENGFIAATKGLFGVR